MRFLKSKILFLGVLLLMSPRITHAKSKTVATYAPVLWVDASANIDRMSSRDKVAKIFDKCVDSGIKTIIVDAKPGAGLVIYKSQIAPRMLNWKGKSYDPNYDYLQTMIEEGHKRGLKVFADFFVFSEGHGVYRVGPIFDTHPEWAAVLLTKDGLVPVTQIKDKLRGNTNPVNPEVQRYELSLMEEVVKNYDVDGILLDGCRFDSIFADFSELTHQAFQRYLAETNPGNRRDIRLRNWPQEVMSYDSTTSTQYKEGPLFKQWLSFRAKVIHDFFAKARETVKAIKPKVLFTDYAGAWYPSYYDVGVNWGSKKHIPKFDWTPKGYEKFGYAEMLDFFCAGCYYYEVTKQEAMAKDTVKEDERGEAGMRKDISWENSVEGSAELVNDAIEGVTPVYGTLYIATYQDHPRQFVRAMEMIKKKTNGLALYDLSQLDGYNYWKWVKLANSKKVLSEEEINAVPEKENFSKVGAVPNTTEDFAEDNLDATCIVTGDWKHSTSQTGFFGKDYLAIEAGTGKNSVKWTPRIVTAGKYRVSACWTSESNRATNATYLIHSKDGDKKVTVNQKEKGGLWIDLGTFQFDKGTSGYVLITDNANGYVIADAIRFTKVT